MPSTLYPQFSKARALPSGVPYRVYGTMGDSFLQSSILASLLEWLLPEDVRDFNLDSLGGDSATLPDLLSRCGTFPFLSDRRVVILRHAEQLEGMGRAGDEAAPKGKGSPSKRLAEAIAGLPDSTTLILSRSAETPEAGARKETPRCINSVVDKAITEKGMLIDCTIGAKAGPMAVAVVTKEAMARGIPLARGAAEYLVARVGNDVANLLSELDKCALRAGEGVVVTAAVIDEMTLRSPTESIFDLMDAIGSRNGARALALLGELLNGGQAPQLVLSMIATNLRQLLQARAFVEAGVRLDAGASSRLPPELAAQLPQDSRENLVEILQRQSWRGSRLEQQARNFTTAQLQLAQAGALAADLAMKGATDDGGTPELQLEIFLARLC